MIHLLAKLTPADGEPYAVEGFGALCCECGALYTCDTRAEQQALHDGSLACPECGNISDVCAGPCCIFSATTGLKSPGLQVNGSPVHLKAPKLTPAQPYPL